LINLLILLFLVIIVAVVSAKLWVPLLYTQIEEILLKINSKKLLTRFYYYILTNKPGHTDGRTIIKFLEESVSDSIIDYDFLAICLEKITQDSPNFKYSIPLLAECYKNLEEHEEEKRLRILMLDLDKKDNYNRKRLIELVKKLSENKKREQQIANFEELSNLLPDNIEVKKNLGILYEEALNIEKMQILYEEILNYSPDETQIRLKLIVLFFQKQDYAKAFKLASELSQDQNSFKKINENNKFQKILKTEGSSSEFSKQLIRFINQIKNIEIFKILAEIWEGLPPENPQYFLGALLNEKLNNLEKSIEYLETWIFSHEKDYDNHYYLADLYRRIKNEEKAFFLYRKMLTLFPEKSDEINICIEKISNNAPADSAIHNHLMELAEKSNHANDLIKQYEERLKKEPSNIEFLEKLAALYSKSSLEDKVQIIYEKLVKLKPDNLLYLENLAGIYINQNKLGRAKECLKKIVSQKEDPLILSKLSELYLFDNNFKDAAACLKKLVDANEATLDQYYSLGEAAFLDHQYETAVEYLEKLLLIAPEYKDFSHNLIGHCYMKLKNFDAAKNNFRAIDFKGDTLTREQKIDILEKMAEEFILNNMKNDARPLLKRIISMDSEHERARELLLKAAVNTNKKSARSASETETRIEKFLSDRYRDITEISRGGMGIIYKGTDKKLNRTVALKVLPENLKQDNDILKRFLREAQAAASLNHSNIVQIFDVENGNPTYIAMEYIEGQNLREILKQEKRIPVITVKKIALQTMEALDYAHDKGIVHRDIKPDNIMLTHKGDVKITDFGLAKIEYATSMTQIGVVMGTEWYMSPEQIRGLEADRRSDIYAYGMTLYELLTGKPPFYKGDIGYQHINVEPPSPKEKNDAIPEALERLIMKCISKKPERRFQNGKIICEILKTL
jgi:tetratricopeptide (TPR) repeat protein